MQKRDLAIILRSVAYEERHRIVTALTENHGRVEAMARNSIQSRRFGGTLDLFAASEWQFVDKGGDLARLDEAQIRRSFEGIHKDFEKLSLGSVFCEFMLRLAPKNEASPELFKLHSNALAALEEVDISQNDRALLQLLNGYLAKLLQWTGSQPRLQRCHGCQKPLNEMDDDASLSCLVADAAWVCPSCRSLAVRHVTQGDFNAAQLRVTPMAILDFLMCLVSPIRQVPLHARASKDEHKSLFLFIEALFAYHQPGFDKKPLNGLRFLGLESNLLLQAASPR